MNITQSLICIVSVAFVSACAAPSAHVAREQAVTGQQTRPDAAAAQLSADEIAKATRYYMDSADTDRNGLVSREEFVAQLARDNTELPSGVEETTIVDSVFRNFDSDASGSISEVELALMFARHSNQACKGPNCK